VPDDPGEDDAWYDHQLVGLRVLDPAGAELGEVVAVEHPPAQDLLVVRRPDGARRFVPFVAALVPAVDVAAGHVVVDAPPGLLDDPPDEPPDGTGEG
jgi:16S rRNA processing protein RimM